MCEQPPRLEEGPRELSHISYKGMCRCKGYGFLGYGKEIRQNRSRKGYNLSENVSN